MRNHRNPDHEENGTLIRAQLQGYKRPRVLEQFPDLYPKSIARFNFYSKIKPNFMCCISRHYRF